MKKIITPFFLVILLLSVLSTSIWEERNTTAYAEYMTTERTLKNDILSELSNYNTDFTFAYEGDFINMKALVQSVMDEIRKTNSYIYENVSKWQLAMKYKGNIGTLTFKINYLTNKQKENHVTAEVKKILPKIIIKDATQVEKIKAVHDYIVLNGSYSSNTKNSQYSTYTFLTEGKGVCQAYALLMLKMLDELKIEAKYVKGYSNNERHAWILVKVDQQWYHVDPTWDDPIGNQADEVRYKYFMLTDKQIAATHSWEKSEYPVAKSEKYKSFHIATQAYTIKNNLYYLNENDKKYYQMNIKTLEATAITAKQFQQTKKTFVAAK